MTDTRGEHLLFVYGSLKRGQPNHGQLARATWVGVRRTEPRFALRVIDGFPALVPGSCAVRGELYQIATEALLELDEFEGPGYRRVEIELAGGLRALSYLAREATDGRLFAGDEWPGP